MIEIKKLKHGSIPVVSVPDPVTRDILMRMNENVVGLSAQLQELQAAVIKNQRDVGGLSAKVSALESV